MTFQTSDVPGPQLRLQQGLHLGEHLRVQLLEERDLPSSSWMLDFGTATSAAAPGYTPVPLVNYTAAQGFGWQRTADRIPSAST